ncbi:filamentous hemagglutinin N-terminal domain-containing protein [Pseudomonas sp. R3.Fl]|uniref:two-partner secretion domain-containing protein n=1 Tax=Pseudomonas sp. R3.Fl TaxID=2928708 RepID=UPI00201DBF30|nr:filamentous hemagglutinin N-terminal domain-containing protein [Pseudomonas sp. R3.Fl]MCL6690635.1 filamentous hemagglutinin N-terminal domain-containing protein [Pseudomonas sp. R3.Fl]
MDIRRPLYQAIASALAGILFLEPIIATAAQLAVDAAAGGNTQIGAAGNGVPIVNIATPNGSGLSHNKFSDYNVGQQGLILNNATGKTQGTQLGGIIIGNPNLKGQAAQKILNEVTGGSPSQLKGYTEVAGQGAHVIVANPHGITCNGCGFINTPRATLSTGKPILAGERLQGYDVDGGEIAIEGAGLNASNLDQFELITRSAKLNADLYARQLTVVAGRNTVDAQTLAATAKPDDGSAKPQLAIDSSALGGMYANTIRLVGTEQGVGVKLAGNMAASAGDIRIDANGRLELAQVAASGDLALKGQDVALNGPAYAGGSASVQASGALSNAQSLAAGSAIELKANQLSNSGVIEAGVNADNSRNARGDVAIDAQNLRNSGSLIATRQLRARAAVLDNRNGQIGGQHIHISGGALDNRLGLFAAEQSLRLDLASLDNSGQGTLTSRGTLHASLAGKLDNSADGLIHSAGNLTLAAQHIDSSRGEISTQADADIRTRQLSLRGGRLLGNGALGLDLQGGDLDNSQGGLLSAGTLRFKQLGTVDNRGGEISSQQSFALGARLLDNRDSGRIISAGRLDLQADRLLNASLGLLSGWQGLSVGGGSLDNSQGGTLSSKAGALAVSLAGALNNASQGALVSQGDQRISAASLDNRGGIVSAEGNVELAIADTLDNRDAGLIDAQRRLDFSHAATRLLNQGGQISAGSLLLKGRSLDNSGGQLLSQGALEATLSGALINANNARLSSGAGLLLKAASLDNRGGQLSSQSTLELILGQGGLDNRDRGTLASQGALRIEALGGRLLNGNDGLVHSVDSLSLRAAGLDNQQGQVSSQGDASLALSGALNNAWGRIQSDGGKLDLGAASIDNSGGILNAAQGLLRIVTGYFGNDAGVAQGVNLDAQATGGIGNRQGHLAATAGQAKIDTGGAALDNRDGGLYAGNQLTLAAGDFLNGNGKVGAKGIDFSLRGALNNDGGLIEAGDWLSLDAASLSNAQGRLRALGQSGSTRIATRGLLDNRQGTLETAADTLQLSGGALHNAGGTVLHAGNGQFLVDLGQLGQAGGHFITQSALDINAPDWTLNSSLQARQLTLNVDRLQLGSDGQLLAVQGFDGSGGHWRNDGLIASDAGLSLNLSGTYGGAGRLTSLGDLSLGARQVELGAAASIAGGSAASVTANGLSNHGRISSAGDLGVRVASLDNFGSLGSAAGLRVEAGNLLNQGGLLFSGGDMALRVGTFSNRAGDLYSLGNLHIAANDQNGWAAKVENVSGSIESAGALTLLAQDFDNRRGDDFRIGQHIVAGNIRLYADDMCDGKGCEFRFQSWERYEDVITQDSPQATITAGGDFIFRGGAFANLYSSIASGGDIDIQAASFRNQGAAGGVERHLDGAFYTRTDAYYWTFRSNQELYNRYNDPNSPDYDPGALSRQQVLESGGYPEHNFHNLMISEVQVSGAPAASAVIQAAGNVSIIASEQFDNSVVRRDAGAQSIDPRDVSTATGAATGQFAITSQLPPDLAQQQVNPLELPGFSLPSGGNGLFRLSGEDGSAGARNGPDLAGLGQGLSRVQGVPGNAAPGNSHKYLIETNPELTSLKSFLGSDYLLGLLGYDPDQAQKRLGDGLYEQRLIQQALVARTGQRFIDGMASDEALFKYLMDNAIAYKDSLNLTVGVGLTAEQVAALTHDIVWLEEAVVNGEKVLVPVLYLAQADNRLAPNGALIQGQNLSLISGGALNNAGTLRASGDLGASAANIGNSGLIEAGKRLDLLATESIRNTAGGILKGRDVSLTALTGDVINERSITTLDLSAGNDRIHKEIANAAARIEASGDLAINAGRDLLSVGSAIQAGGDAYLQAGRDLRLEAAEETDRADFQSRRMQGSLASTTQHASEISVGGNLDASAGRDLRVIASHIDATGDIALGAGRDVTLASAANEDHSQTKYKGGGKKVEQQDDQVRQQGSSLSAGGDVVVSAGQNLTLVASQISAGNEAYLVAGDKLELLADYDSDYALYSEEKKGGFGSKKTQRDEVTDVKAVGSQISAGSDITLLSGGDQKYQGAKLESGNDITLLSGGSVTFEAVKDLHQESHEKSKGNLAWQSAKGKGQTDETLRQSQLIAQGELAIKSVEGLKIDIKHIDQKSVGQTIDAMVQADPDLAWLKEAEARGDVDWRRVQEVHDGWKYSSSGMGPAAQLAVAIILSVATYGAASTAVGTAAGATAGSSTAMAAAGVSATGAAVAAGWGNVALASAAASLGSTAGISLINSQGNLGATLDDALSSDSLKQAMIAAGVAGSMAAYGPEWFGGKTDPTTNTTTAAGKGIGAIPDLANPEAWSRFAGMQLAQGALTGAANDLLGQGNFSDSMQGALYGILQASAFKYVGDLGFPSGGVQNTVAHAIAGGLLAEAMGGDFKTGAMAAGASEALANVLTSGFLEGDSEKAKRMQQAAAQLAGIVAAGSVNGDLQMGGDIAKNGMAYNRQLHPTDKELARSLAERSGGKYTAEQIEEQLRLSNVKGSDIGAGTDILANREDIYDTGGNWVELDNGQYLQQFAKLDLDIVTYIQSSTDAYSWAAFPIAPGQDWAKAPAAGSESRDRLTGYVLDETGRYTVPITVEGVSYSPRFLPCASAECIAVGANIDLSNAETLRYLKAADAKSLNGLGKILSMGAIVSSGGAATGLAFASNIPALMSGYMKSDFSGALTSAALSSGFESYARSRGLSPEAAGKIANVLNVMGAWDGIIESGRNNFK